MSMTPVDDLRERERRAEEGGGAERLQRQHEAGKLTARERIDLLFDPGTFEEGSTCCLIPARSRRSTSW